MPRTYTRLTDSDILAAFAAGRVSIDPDRGEVIGLRESTRKRKGPATQARRYVRIYHNGGRINAPVAKLVWLWVTRIPVPDGFEIHHRDDNNTNDAWDNLLCVHVLDHRKLHSAMPIPF